MTHDWSFHPADDDRLTFCTRCGKPDTAKARRTRCQPVERPEEIIRRNMKWLSVLDDAMANGRRRWVTQARKAR